MTAAPSSLAALLFRQVTMSTPSPLRILALAIAAALTPAAAPAQTPAWPARTVTVIVPFAPGGNTDVMARMASARLAAELKQTFVVENRVGAGGALAANQVAQAAPDGYTLLFGAARHTTSAHRTKKATSDPAKGSPRASFSGPAPFTLATTGAIPAKTIRDFAAYGKGRKLNYGSGGVGSIGHLSGALFVARAG